MRTFILSLAFLCFGCAQPVLADPYPSTNCVTVTPTIDTAAYATGDYMGASTPMSFTGALRSSTGSGYITAAWITDKAAQAFDIDLIIFKSNPTATTFTDNAAFAPATADLLNIVAPINFGSTSRFAFSANSIHYVGNLMYPVTSAGTTLYGALVARGAYDGTSSSDLAVTLCTSQD